MAEVNLQAFATQIAAIASADSSGNTNLAAIPDPAATSASATYTSYQTKDPIEGPLRQLLFAALLPVGLVIAPFWYLGAPVTLPLFSMATTGTTASTYASIITMMGWLIAPLSLSYALVPLEKIPVTVTYEEGDAIQPAATASPPAISASAPSVPVAEPAPTDVGEASSDGAPAAALLRSTGRGGTGKPLAARNTARPAAASEHPPLVAAESEASSRTASAPSAVSADRAAKNNRRAAGGSRGTDSSNRGRG